MTRWVVEEGCREEKAHQSGEGMGVYLAEPVPDMPQLEKNPRISLCAEKPRVGPLPFPSPTLLLLHVRLDVSELSALYDSGTLGTWLAEKVLVPSSAPVLGSSETCVANNSCTSLITMLQWGESITIGC